MEIPNTQEAQRVLTPLIDKWAASTPFTPTPKWSTDVTIEQWQYRPALRIQATWITETRSIKILSVPDSGKIPSAPDNEYIPPQRFDPWAESIELTNDLKPHTHEKPALSTRRIIQCDGCAGTGNQSCSACGGRGRLGCDDCDGSGRLQLEKSISRSIPCDFCNGNGFTTRHGGSHEQCNFCFGRGCKSGTQTIVENVACGACSGSGSTVCRCSGSGREKCRQCRGNGRVLNFALIVADETPRQHQDRLFDGDQPRDSWAELGGESSFHTSHPILVVDVPEALHGTPERWGIKCGLPGAQGWIDKKLREISTRMNPAAGSKLSHIRIALEPAPIWEVRYNFRSKSYRLWVNALTGTVWALDTPASGESLAELERARTALSEGNLEFSLGLTYRASALSNKDAAAIENVRAKALIRLRAWYFAGATLGTLTGTALTESIATSSWAFHYRHWPFILC